MALNILLVDDSTVMRRMIIKTTRLCGLEIGEIYQAENGEAGLSMLQEQRIELY